MNNARPTTEQLQAIRDLIRTFPKGKSSRIANAHAIAALIVVLFANEGWKVPRLAKAFIWALKELPRDD